MNVGEKIKVYLGITDKGGVNVGASLVFKSETPDSTYPASKVFIHPLLGTDEVCTFIYNLRGDPYKLIIT